MSYYRRLPIDVRVATFISRNAAWFTRALCALPIIVALAWLARSWGLG